MKTRLLAIVALVMAAGLGALSAQDVQRSAKAPAIDGSFGTSEYSFTHVYQGMQFGATLSPDGSTLLLAIKAPTRGWVAIGLGSTIMDGAYIVMGADGGAPKVIEQLGQGHFHGNTADKVRSSAVKTADGGTVLEFSVPAADFVSQGKLEIILAYGASTDFRTRHVTHASFVLSVQS